MLSTYPPLIAQPLGRARAALATLSTLEAVRSTKREHYHLDDAIGWSGVLLPLTLKSDFVTFNFKI